MSEQVKSAVRTIKKNGWQVSKVKKISSFWYIEASACNNLGTIKKTFEITSDGSFNNTFLNFPNS